MLNCSSRGAAAEHSHARQGVERIRRETSSLIKNRGLPAVAALCSRSAAGKLWQHGRRAGRWLPSDSPPRAGSTPSIFLGHCETRQSAPRLEMECATLASATSSKERIMRSDSASVPSATRCGE
jgi:hypothetical protein